MENLNYKAKVHKNSLYGQAIRPAGIPIDILIYEKGCLPATAFKGDWCDLFVSKDYDLKQGDFMLLDLGVAMKLPPHLEAHLIVRSSTFKKYGLIQTNGMGIIDNSYCGNEDRWKLPVYATRDIHIPAFTRLCQFRVIAKQPTIHFNIVDDLKAPNRGGFGSTGY